ncbi:MULTISPECIES: ABC transporter permease [Cyanophyceae]|uniref:ABC transporter permease n=1 Tax=Cyanophyceae TaxID=3028117 RepID=UPI001681DD72|nr:MULTISPECIES: ABC transporter permease [Cyanophyceae]MBD1915579.1 ABC transporter permease [Phormidium sp. FACHB-77]MBD2031889.1 ABC transporter permease [Phormidium sp. FACHB-322]MBD2050639.1 ABC transporter permease [Leptolyngbya sp. FACHB-60]
MNLQESLSMATKTLAANRLRSTLTMLGIIIGNASVITMVGLGEGAQRYVTAQLETLGPNVLFIVPGSRETRELGSLEVPRTLVLDDATAIAEQVPSVSGVAAESSGLQLVTFRNRNANINVVGTTPDFLTVRSFEVANGRFISELDVSRSAQVAVVGETLRERLFDDESGLGQKIRVGGINFDIIGVLEKKGSNLGLNYDDAVMVPLTTKDSRLGGSERSPYGIEVSFITVSARDRASMATAEFQITNLLRLRHNIRDKDDFYISSQDSLLTIANTITGALTLMLAAIAGISLFVGGIGIMNIMLVSVRERTQEIGLRKAIGASQGDILGQFLIEAIILSIAGGVIGTAVGVSGILLIGVLTPFEAGISAGAILLTVSVSGGIGLFFGVFPARQAAKLDPIVALRTA